MSSITAGFLTGWVPVIAFTNQQDAGVVAAQVRIDLDLCNRKLNVASDEVRLEQWQVSPANEGVLEQRTRLIAYSRDLLNKISRLEAERKALYQRNREVSTNTPVIASLIHQFSMLNMSSNITVPGLMGKVPPIAFTNQQDAGTVVGQIQFRLDQVNHELRHCSEGRASELTAERDSLTAYSTSLMARIGDLNHERETLIRR